MDTARGHTCELQARFVPERLHFQPGQDLRLKDTKEHVLGWIRRASQQENWVFGILSFFPPTCFRNDSGWWCTESTASHLPPLFRFCWVVVRVIITSLGGLLRGVRFEQVWWGVPVAIQLTPPQHTYKRKTLRGRSQVRQTGGPVPLCQHETSSQTEGNCVPIQHFRMFCANIGWDEPSRFQKSQLPLA